MRRPVGVLTLTTVGALVAASLAWSAATVAARQGQASFNAYHVLSGELSWLSWGGGRTSSQKLAHGNETHEDIDTYPHQRGGAAVGQSAGSWWFRSLRYEESGAAISDPSSFSLHSDATAAIKEAVSDLFVVCVVPVAVARDSRADGCAAVDFRGQFALPLADRECGESHVAFESDRSTREAFPEKTLSTERRLRVFLVSSVRSASEDDLGERSVRECVSAHTTPGVQTIWLSPYDPCLRGGMVHAACAQCVQDVHDEQGDPAHFVLQDQLEDVVSLLSLRAVRRWITRGDEVARLVNNISALFTFVCDGTKAQPCAAKRVQELLLLAAQATGREDVTLASARALFPIAVLLLGFMAARVLDSGGTLLNDDQSINEVHVESSTLASDPIPTKERPDTDILCRPQSHHSNMRDQAQAEGDHESKIPPLTEDTDRDEFVTMLLSENVIVYSPRRLGQARERLRSQQSARHGP